MFIECCSDFGPDRPDMGLRVQARPTRPLPSPQQYLTTLHSGTQGVFHDGGARGTYSDVFVFQPCAVTVAHSEITCVVPPGYGGQLEWTVEVLDQVSVPFRCGAMLSLDASVDLAL